MCAQKRASGSVIVRCAVDEREEGRARTAGTQASVVDRPDLHVYGHTRTESVNNRVLAAVQTIRSTYSFRIHQSTERKNGVNNMLRAPREKVYVPDLQRVYGHDEHNYTVPDASTGTDAP